VVRLVLRPLFVLLTLAMLVVALFQVSGRLMFAVLDELELGVNQWLSDQRIVLTGLEGDWRGINPVVRVRRVDLPAGHLSGIRAELDWLESLIRNRVVARSVTLDEGRLVMERTADGWRLRGAAGGGSVNVFDTLYNSDELAASLRIGLAEGSGEAVPADDLLISYRATNRGGAHAHRLQVSNADCAGDCSVSLALDDVEPILFVRPRATSVLATGSGLRLPDALLGLSGGRLDMAEGQWWRLGDDAGGEVRLTFGGLAMARDEVLSGTVRVTTRGEEETHHVQLAEGQLQTASRQWQIPPVWMHYESGMLRAWTERIETGDGLTFLTALVPRDTAVYRWLDALRVQAVALNVHGFVHFPDLETGFSATVRDVSLDGYNGAPWIRGGAGELLGANRAIQLSINATDLGVQFPDIFHQRWVMEHLTGRLKAYIGSGYFGLRGTNLRAELNGSRASGGFAVSRPEDRYRERLSLLINVDETTVARGKGYIPYRLPAGLPEWLDSGPRRGNLEDVALAYHGQIHTRPGELARRVEFSARIEDGEVEYHPDWPIVEDLSGHIAVAGRDVRIGVDRGRSLTTADLSGSRIRLRDDAAFAEIDLVSRTSVDEALTFVRTTPLVEWMGFVTPDWAGEGGVTLDGRLQIPLKLGGDHIGGVRSEEYLAVDMTIDLAGADLDLPGYGVFLEALSGNVRYVYPHGVSARGVRGRIFDRPAMFGATSDDDTVIFHVVGQAPYEDVLTLLNVADPGVIHGGFDFIADLHIEMEDALSRLDVVSDLTGLALDLPGEFRKAPEDVVPTELELRFLPTYQSARFRYGSAQGWMHVDEVPLRGSIGFAAPPPVVDTTASELVLAGRISGFAVEDVVPDGEGTSSLTLPVRLDGLQVDAIDVGGIRFENTRLSGTIGAGDGTDVRLSVDSPDLVGTLVVAGDQPLDLDLALLRLPAGEEEVSDPLSPDIASELTAADVVVEQLIVGDNDYGAWAFALRPEDQGVALESLAATLRGVTIESDRLFWDTAANRSHFSGSLSAGNLAEVLPHWDFAPSVATESAFMQADLSWPGSPAAVDLDVVVGQASFQADNGRFLEVSAGGTDAMKIFSLVNFSTIAKRLNFDFSDVVGEGVSFDLLTATTDFDSGMMHFIEPMEVEGSGSSFRIAGSVDLVEGTLDNEMIVTLPVSRGLPWYAAYVALANPLAGLGVLVGERVLRKPLEQFSSAKYEISGTLTEPELKFVGVWDVTMDRPQVTLEQLDGEELPPEPVETEPSADAVELEEGSAMAESTTG
jgi:uncharacterized protein YhdP